MSDSVIPLGSSLNSAAVTRAVRSYMSIPEAADYLCCKRARIDDLLSARRIPRVKEGSRTLIRRRDLDAYLNREMEG